MQGASDSLAGEQRDALRQITDDAKRHLAMTYYLRAGDSIVERWSWTHARVEAYRRSAEFSEARAEIEKIAARFAAENPPYRLYTNTQVRSLEEQVARWQSVASIGVAANELRKAALAELSAETYTMLPSAASLQRFRQFLIAWRAPRPPTLAAPGMSLHGRGRAFDFQIRDEMGRTVAGTDTATIRTVWDAQGWAKKLSRTVHAASDRLAGPLAAPREPWHYEYRSVGGHDARQWRRE